jgi:hypothetical protein
MAKWKTPSPIKQDLSFITKHSLKTNNDNLRPADVVRLVRSFIGVKLYGTDIESIDAVPGGYVVTIHPRNPFYCGTFKIKYRKYII